MTLVTVKLLGELGRRFGREFRFDISCPAEAIALLRVNFPGLDQYLRDTHEQGVGYRFVVKGRDRSEEQLVDPLGSATLVICPAVYGSGGGFFRIIAGVALIGIGLFTGFTPLALLGASLVLGGISQLLSPNPKNNKNKESKFFSGPVNTTNQGNPVPTCYGRLMVGSHVISAGISLDAIVGEPAPRWYCSNGQCYPSINDPYAPYATQAECEAALVVPFTGGQCSADYDLYFEGESSPRLTTTGPITSYGYDGYRNDSFGQCCHYAQITGVNGKVALGWYCSTNSCEVSGPPEGASFVPPNMYIKRRDSTSQADDIAQCGNPPSECPTYTRWYCSNGVCYGTNDPAAPYATQSDCESALITPSFTGGQCNTQYYVTVDFVSKFGTTSRQTTSAIQGPIEGVEYRNYYTQICTEDSAAGGVLFNGGQFHQLIAGSDWGKPVTHQITGSCGPAPQTPTATIVGITRVDGLPDDCGDPPATCP